MRCEVTRGERSVEHRDRQGPIGWNVLFLNVTFQAKRSTPDEFHIAATTSNPGETVGGEQWVCHQGTPTTVVLKPQI